MSTAAPAVPDRARIEDILPLSAVQEAHLLATLAARGVAHDPGFLQLRCTLRGELDESAFRRAWQVVVDRHAALRSSVHWKDAARPLQVVTRDVTVPLMIEDWREGGEEKLAAYLGADRERGIDLTRTPTMRVALARVASHEWILLWTCHHLLLDGWSGALVLGEVAASYESLRCGTQPRLPPTRPLREFSAWLRRQDDATSVAFWRAALAGLDRPTPLPFDAAHEPGARMPVHRTVTRRLDAGATAELSDLTRRHRLTAGALLHSAWAILLAGFTGEERVCFGTTVSGRAVPVPGIDTIVGTFTNALPIVAHVVPGMPVVDLVRAVQDRIVALQARAHDAPARIQATSTAAGARRLFESLVVVENFPAELFRTTDGHLRWGDLQGGVTSNHPLVLVASPGDRLELTLLHDERRIAAADAAAISDALVAVLSRITADARTCVGALLPADGRGRPHAVDRNVPADDVAPANGQELRLWKVWERVLGTSSFGVEDDFFELGGYSLLVARLLTELERTFGTRVPLGVVFDHPTVRTMARAIAALETRPPADTSPRPRMLVPLSEGTAPDARPTLFLLHGLRGDVVDCYNLVRHLGAEQRIIGIQADGAPDAATTLEQLAARYAELIRTEQPNGPCVLGGYCFGGTLAYETARQLAAAGHDVERVVVIDGDARMPRWPRTSRWMLAWWNLQLTPPGQRAAVFGRKVRKAARMLIGRNAPDRDGGAGDDAPAGVHGPFLDCYRRYDPRPLPGVCVTVILAQDDPPGLVRWRRARWSALVGDEADILAVPGTHYTLMGEPLVRGVAERVRSRLSASA